MKTEHGLAKRFRFTLPLGITGVSFLLSSIPGDSPGGGLLGFVAPQVQNLLHIPLFALLAWSWCLALGRPSTTLATVVMLAASISAAWAILDELHQYYVPGRFASLTDITLNLTGVVVGLLIYTASTRSSAPRQKNKVTRK